MSQCHSVAGPCQEITDEIMVSQQLVIPTSMHTVTGATHVYGPTTWYVTKLHPRSKTIVLQGIEPQTTQTYTVHSKPLSYKAIMGSIHTIAIITKFSVLFIKCWLFINYFKSLLYFYLILKSDSHVSPWNKFFEHTRWWNCFIWYLVMSSTFKLTYLLQNVVGDGQVT